MSDLDSLGVDIGGSSVKAVLLTGLHGDHQLAEDIRSLSEGRTVDESLDVISSIARTMSDEHGAPGAIGVALPGMFDIVRGAATLLPNFPLEWVGYPVRDALEQRLGQPVHLVNDAKAFAIAESVIGAGVGSRNVACVVLGTGGGGGVVLDGSLWTGQGSAGEFGHITVDLNGALCGCGNRGCVEAYAGSAAIAEQGGMASAEQVLVAAGRGDARAVAAVDRAIEALGAALANVFITLAPDVFVVGGGIALSADVFLGALERQIRDRVRVADGDRITVVRGALGRNAGAIGAALMARQHFDPSTSPTEVEHHER